MGKTARRVDAPACVPPGAGLAGTGMESAEAAVPILAVAPGTAVEMDCLE